MDRYYTPSREEEEDMAAVEAEVDRLTREIDMEMKMAEQDVQSTGNGDYSDPLSQLAYSPLPSTWGNSYETDPQHSSPTSAAPIPASTGYSSAPLRSYSHLAAAATAPSPAKITPPTFPVLPPSTAAETSTSQSDHAAPPSSSSSSPLPPPAMSSISPPLMESQRAEPQVTAPWLNYRRRDEGPNREAAKPQMPGESHGTTVDNAISMAIQEKSQNRLADLEKELARTKKLLQAKDETIAKERERYRHFEVETKELSAEFEASQATISSLETQLAEARRQVADWQESIDTYRKEREQYKTESAAKEKELQKLTRERATWKAKAETAEANVQTFSIEKQKGQLEAVQGQVAGYREECEKAREAAAAAQQACVRAEEAADRARRDAEEASKKEQTWREKAQGVVKANRALAEEYTRAARRLELSTGNAVFRVPFSSASREKEEQFAEITAEAMKAAGLTWDGDKFTVLGPAGWAVEREKLMVKLKNEERRVLDLTSQLTEVGQEGAAEVASLKQLVVRLTSDLEASHAAILGLKEEYEEALGRTRVEVTQLRSQLSMLEDSAAAKDREISTLRADLSQSRSTHAEEKRLAQDRLTQAAERLKAERQRSLDFELRAERAEASADESLAERRRVQAEIMGLEKEKTKLKEEVARLRKHSSSSETAVKEARKLATRWEDIATEKEEQLRKLQQQLGDIESERKDSMVVAHSSEKQLQLLRKENANLQEALDTLAKTLRQQQLQWEEAEGASRDRRLRLDAGHALHGQHKEALEPWGGNGTARRYSGSQGSGRRGEEGMKGTRMDMQDVDEEEDALNDGSRSQELDGSEAADEGWEEEEGVDEGEGEEEQAEDQWEEEEESTGAPTAVAAGPPSVGADEGNGLRQGSLPSPQSHYLAEVEEVPPRERSPDLSQAVMNRVAELESRLQERDSALAQLLQQMAASPTAAPPAGGPSRHAPMAPLNTGMPVEPYGGAAWPDTARSRRVDTASTASPRSSPGSLDRGSQRSGPSPSSNFPLSFASRAAAPPQPPAAQAPLARPNMSSRHSGGSGPVRVLLPSTWTEDASISRVSEVEAPSFAHSNSMVSSGFGLDRQQLIAQPYHGLSHSSRVVVRRNSLPSVGSKLNTSGGSAVTGAGSGEGGVVGDWRFPSPAAVRVGVVGPPRQEFPSTQRPPLDSQTRDAQ